MRENMEKFLLSVILSFFVLPGFAIDCQDRDEKLVKVDAPKLATDMYNKTITADGIKRRDYKTADGAYTSGRWKVQNEKDENLNVVGVSICSDNNESLDFKNIKVGNYCWCNIESIDNYRISSKWYHIEEYNNYKFDVSKYKDNENLAKQKQEDMKNNNIQDCLANCAKSCLTKRSSLIHKIDGFYVCDDALYKLHNVRCTVDNKFINATSILVFNDMAEIQILGGGSIVFTSENNSDYIGEYDNLPIYLKVKNNEIYVGRKKLWLTECL